MSRQVTLLSTRETMTLITECVCPPIPVRNLDWSAYRDGDDEPTDFDGETMTHWSTAPHGTGRHEIDAIHDLFDQLESA